MNNLGFLLATLFLIVGVIGFFAARRRFRALKKDCVRCREDLSQTSKVLFQKILELADYNKKTMELLDLRTIFIDVFAHHLRTPVTGIKWGLSSLEKKVVKEAETEHLFEEMRKRVQTIEKMIEGILSAARIAATEPGAIRETISDPKALLGELAGRYQEKFLSKKVKFIVSLAEALPSLKANKDLIREIFETLLENAFWYTSAGGEVFLEAKLDGEELVVNVKDSGIGIAEDDFGKIFQRFYRAPNAIRTHPNGAGLGLYTVKKIVEFHEGKILCESKENEGTVFTVRLPVA